MSQVWYFDEMLQSVKRVLTIISEVEIFRISRLQTFVSERRNSSLDDSWKPAQLVGELMSLNKFLHSFAKFQRKHSNMTLGHPGGKTRNLTETRNNWFDNNTKLKFSQLFLNNWSRPKKKRVLYFNDSFTCQVKNFCSCNRSLHDNIWLKRQNMKYAHFRPDMITCNFLSSAKNLSFEEKTHNSRTQCTVPSVQAHNVVHEISTESLHLL